MKKLYITILTICLTSAVFAQQKAICTANFDNFTLASESYWDGSDQTGGFTGPCGIWNFNNFYDTAWGGYWASGWAYSNQTDISTAGSLFSSYVGDDFNGGGNYAVASAFGTGAGIRVAGLYLAMNVEFFVSTSTYTAVSVLNGDGIGKVFGDSLDANGDDDGTNGEDWFKLTVYGYQSGSIVDSQEVYLVDYRFAADSMDYILDTWKAVVMSSPVDSLHFFLTSSDVGAGGVNTPSFFCLDNLSGDFPTSIKEVEIDRLKLYPNPANDYIFIEGGYGTLEVYSITGSLVLTAVVNGLAQVDISSLNTGLYQVILKGQNGISSAKLFKE
ncbi:MAG: DUF4465 domain-containing protein [Flavobacteriales bacterium]|nr:DUF4465 domain-containing protein [Flavobacteriales bacterium]